MARIDDVRKLPSWFKQENRYSIFKNASLVYLGRELALRRFVDLEIKKGISDSVDQQELFSERELFCSDKLECKGNDGNQYVYPFSAGALFYQAHLQSDESKNSGLFSEVNKKNYDVYNGEGLVVGLSIAYATDTEILEELEALLPSMRQMLNMPEPDTRLYMRPRIKNLRSGAVFEYLDLTLWAKANGHKIDGDILAIAIKSVGFTAKEISDNLRIKAKELLTIEFSDQLETEINRQFEES